MVGIVITPSSTAKADSRSSSVDLHAGGLHAGLSSLAGDLGGTCRTGGESFFIAFDPAKKAGRLALFLFADGLGEVFSASNAFPDSYFFYIDSSHGVADDLFVRMRASTSSFVRAGKPGSLLATQAASELCASLWWPGFPLPGDGALTDFGSVASAGVSSKIAALVPPAKVEEIAWLSQRLSRKREKAEAPSLIAILGPPHTASRLIEQFASMEQTLDGACSWAVLRVYADSPLPETPHAQTTHTASTAQWGGDRNPLSPLLRALDHYFSNCGEVSPEHADAVKTVRALARSPWRSTQSEDRTAMVAEAAAYCLSRSISELRPQGFVPYVVVHDADLMSQESLSMLVEAAGTCGDDSPAILAAGRSSPRDVHFRNVETLRTFGLSFFDTIQSIRAGCASVSGGIDSDEAAARTQAAAQDPSRLALLLAASAYGCADKGLKRADRDTPTAELALAVLRALPVEIAEYLHLKSLAEILPSREATDGLLAACGFPATVVRILERYLERCGFMIGPPGDASLPAATGNADFGSLLPDSGRRLEDDFAEIMRQAFAVGSLRPSIAALRHSMPCIRFDDGRSVRFALDCAATEAVDGDSSTPSVQPCDPEIASWLRFAKSLASGDGKALSDATASFGGEIPPGAAPAAVRALAEACLEYSERRPLNAAAKGKIALMALRNLGLPREEAIGQRILGLCELGQGRLIQGAAYLSNAYETAESAHEAAEATKALIAETGASFLLGDFVRAALLLDAAGDRASESLDPDAQCAVLFSMGRLDLELGRKDSACEFFRRSGKIAGRFRHRDIALRSEIWAFAAGADTGTGVESAARSVSMAARDDAELLSFRSEAALDRGDRTEARRCSHLAAKAAIAMGQGFASAGPFPWNDGYSGLEGLYAGYSGARSLLMDRTIAWDAYCGALSGEADPLESAMLLQSFAREDRIAQPHPFAHLYLYWLYCLAEEGLAPGFDVPSTISRAFKALQTRAARIDDSEVFDDFVNRNSDHARIVAAARRHRLI